MYASTHPDLVDRIMDFESGYMNDETEIVRLFQDLIDSGLIRGLQGSYQRAAHRLAANGLVTL